MATYQNALEANRKTRKRFDTNRAIPQEFHNLTETLNAGMSNIMQTANKTARGTSSQIIVDFITKDGYKCHITFHTGGPESSGTPGAFHVVIDESNEASRQFYKEIKKLGPAPIVSLGDRGFQHKMYYRFKPVIQEPHLRFNNIQYMPQVPVYGPKRELPTDILNGAMRDVFNAVNAAKIPLGQMPAEQQGRLAAALAKNKTNIEELKIKQAYSAVLPIKLVAKLIKAWKEKEKKQVLIDFWTEEKSDEELIGKAKEVIDDAADAPPQANGSAKGGRRNQTKKRKINRRRNRTRRN